MFAKIGRESGSASQNRETHYLWGESTGMLHHVNISNKSYRRTLPMTNYQNYKHLLQGSLKSLSERS